MFMLKVMQDFYRDSVRNQLFFWLSIENSLILIVFILALPHITLFSLFYILLAIILSILITFFMTSGLSHKLQKLLRIIEQIGLKQETSLPQHQDEFEYLTQLLQTLPETIKTKQKELYEQKECFELALQNAEVGLWDWQLDQCYISYSPRWQRLLGYEASEITPTMDEWRSRIHPDDQAQFNEDLQQHLHGQTPLFENLHRIRHRQGHYLWFLARGLVKKNEQGKANRMIGVCLDVTEYQQMAQAFSDLACYTAFSNTQPLQTSLLHLLSIFNVQSGLIGVFSEELPFKVVTRFVWQEDKQIDNFIYQMDSQLKDKLLQEKAIYFYHQANDFYPQDPIIQSYDSETFVAFLLFSPLSNQPLGLIALYHPQPITRISWRESVLSIHANHIAFALEKEETCSALQQAKEQAETDNRLKLTFLEKLRHELRTPLSGVISITELLQTTSLNEQQQHYTDIIYNSAEALLSILNNTLNTSQLDFGHPQTVPFDLWQLLDETAMMFSSRLDKKELELVYFLDPQLPRQFQGDVVRLRQILTNLLGNAIKFTHAGLITLRISATTADHQPMYVHFTIEDTGVGISEEKQQCLLQTGQIEPFGQHFRGTGLGLTIAKQLVDSLGGEIGFTSYPGQGSLFWFTVPLHLYKHYTATQSEAKYTVLIVDDNPLQCQSLQQQMINWGMQVYLATDGITALHVLQKNPVPPLHFALVEYHSATAQDGVQFVAACRQLPGLPFFPVLLLTHLNDKLNHEKLQQLGIIDQLPKPLSLTRLYNQIEEIVQNPTLPHFPQAAPLVASSKSFKILVAEDSPLNRDVIRDMIKRLGYQVETAEDGQKAVEKYRENHYHLVFMDCEMPILDGYAATQAIRAHEQQQQQPSVPIIALTAHASPDASQALESAGFNQHLTKPLRLKTLQTVLQHWLDTQTLNTQTSETSLTANQTSWWKNNDDPNTCFMPPTNLGSEQVLTTETPMDTYSSPVDFNLLKHLDDIMGQSVRSLIVQQFIEYAPQQVEDIKTMFSQGDLNTVCRKAHQFKGESLQIGANRLGYLCKELEESARHAHLNTLSVNIFKLEQEMDKVREALIQANTVNE